MKLVSQDDDGVVIEFTRRELGLLRDVGTEFTQGEYAPKSDEDFQDLMQASREQVMALFEALP